MDPLRIEANQKYSPKVDVQFLTISKWCEKWLKEDYEQEARYLPNGIHTENYTPVKRDFSGKVRTVSYTHLIGLNGSGKSTMLKIIAGVLKPTKGNVTVRGNVAPLIELGAGFDYDLTAGENIYLNGAILGLSLIHI